jgi:hypothetical protein
MNETETLLNAELRFITCGTRNFPILGVPMGAIHSCWEFFSLGAGASRFWMFKEVDRSLSVGIVLRKGIASMMARSHKMSRPLNKKKKEMSGKEERQKEERQRASRKQVLRGKW